MAQRHGCDTTAVHGDREWTRVSHAALAQDTGTGVTHSPGTQTFAVTAAGCDSGTQGHQPHPGTQTWHMGQDPRPGTSHPRGTVEGTDTATTASVSPDRARSRHRSRVTAAPPQPSTAVTIPRTDGVAFPAPQGTLIPYGFTIKEQSLAPGETEARRDAEGTCAPGRGHQSPWRYWHEERWHKGVPKKAGMAPPSCSRISGRGWRGHGPWGHRGATSAAEGDTIGLEGTRGGCQPRPEGTRSTLLARLSPRRAAEGTRLVAVAAGLSPVAWPRCDTVTS